MPIVPKLAAAKSASMQELLARLQSTADRIQTLSSTSVKVTLTLARAESGKAQVYHSAPGYILIRRPDDLLLNLQVPLTKTTAVMLLSKGDRFELFSPRDQKVYIGSNSAGEFELDENGASLAFTARPIHILEAILPRAISLESADARIAMTEEQDAEAKYYVLSVFRETGTRELQTVRRLWIERSEMALVRVEEYTPSGQVAGIVRYAAYGEFSGVSLPRSILLERPLDGYSLNMQFTGWRVNPPIEESAFAINLPADTKRVILKEKKES